MSDTRDAKLSRAADHAIDEFGRQFGLSERERCERIREAAEARIEILDEAALRRALAQEGAEA